MSRDKLQEYLDKGRISDEFPVCPHCGTVGITKPRCLLTEPTSLNCRECFNTYTVTFQRIERYISWKESSDVGAPFSVRLSFPRPNDQSCDNAPVWFLLRPERIVKLNDPSVYEKIMSQVTGPFFSTIDANNEAPEWHQMQYRYCIHGGCNRHYKDAWRYEKGDQIELEFNIMSLENKVAPYWLIIDPRQMLKPSASVLGSFLSGIFFDRASAQDYLNAKKYNFSNRAKVCCLEGNMSSVYSSAFESARKES